MTIDSLWMDSYKTSSSLVASLNWWLWLGLVGWLVVGVVLDVVIVAVDVF